MAQIKGILTQNVTVTVNAEELLSALCNELCIPDVTAKANGVRWNKTNDGSYRMQVDKSHHGSPLWTDTDQILSDEKKVTEYELLKSLYRLVEEEDKRYKGTF